MKIASLPNYNTRTQNFGHKLGPSVKKDILSVPDMLAVRNKDKFLSGSYSQVMNTLHQYLGKYQEEISKFLDQKLDILHYCEKIYGKDDIVDMKGLIEDIEKYGTQDDKEKLYSILNKLDADKKEDGSKDFTKVQVMVDYGDCHNNEFSSGEYKKLEKRISSAPTFSNGEVFAWMKKDNGTYQEGNYNPEFMDNSFFSGFVKMIYDIIVRTIFSTPPLSIMRENNTIGTKDFLDKVKNS